MIRPRISDRDGQGCIAIRRDPGIGVAVRFQLLQRQDRAAVSDFLEALILLCADIGSVEDGEPEIAIIDAFASLSSQQWLLSDELDSRESRPEEK